jgi:hypothetical protein
MLRGREARSVDAALFGSHASDHGARMRTPVRSIQVTRAGTSIARLVWPRGCGGTGRHDTFRSYCPSGRGGSNPSSRIASVGTMHSRAAIAEVLELRRHGLGARRISRRTGLPVGTVRDWLAGKLPRHSLRVLPGEVVQPACHRCGGEQHGFDHLPQSYSYLLGIYLGDGCISAGPREVFRLRLFLDIRYPEIIDECEAAVRDLVPRNRIHRLERCGNYVVRPEPSFVELSAYSKAWPCLFPQHGPGRKHERRIQLTAWQQRLVDDNPRGLLRGLIHSDGCRFMNTGRGGWRCPRYSFHNSSEDICEIFCDACGQLGLHWTTAPRTVYVSRNADVARLDEFVGPKR